MPCTACHGTLIRFHFQDAQFRAAFDEAQDAVRAAEKELDEADADMKAYTAERDEGDLINALSEDRKLCWAPPGDSPDPQRIVTARKKVAEATSTRATMGLEATTRYNTRTRHTYGASYPITLICMALT